VLNERNLINIYLYHTVSHERASSILS
jgi:hypothetical protein